MRFSVGYLTFFYLYHMNSDHLYTIIVAGGSGTRMNAKVPKQFLTLNGLPILMHTIKAFHTYENGMKIILALPEQDISYWEQHCLKHDFTIPITILKGGAIRFESVRNGLNHIEERYGIVAVHDGVRPLVSQELIHASFSTAIQKGNAVAAIALKDSVRKVTAEGNEAVDRAAYRLVQTPQVFSLPLIKNAYKMAKHANYTDDATVVEASGHPIQLIEGEGSNIKITTPEDLLVAEYLLKSGVIG